jgi:hypothetical protein
MAADGLAQARDVNRRLRADVYVGELCFDLAVPPVRCSVHMSCFFAEQLFALKQHGPCREQCGQCCAPVKTAYASASQIPTYLGPPP